MAQILENKLWEDRYLATDEVNVRSFSAISKK